MLAQSYLVGAQAYYKKKYNTNRYGAVIRDLSDERSDTRVSRLLVKYNTIQYNTIQHNKKIQNDTVQ